MAVLGIIDRMWILVDYKKVSRNPIFYLLKGGL